jgi:hypothetical protein
MKLPKLSELSESEMRYLVGVGGVLAGCPDYVLQTARACSKNDPKYRLECLATDIILGK